MRKEFSFFTLLPDRYDADDNYSNQPSQSEVRRHIDK